MLNNVKIVCRPNERQTIDGDFIWRLPRLFSDLSSSDPELFCLKRFLMQTKPEPLLPLF
jgi:hypothetical protein